MWPKFVINLISGSVLLLIWCAPAWGVGYAPVRNFTRNAYGGASQNWSVSQDPAGRVYFGNGNGLLKFDGSRWSLYPLPNYTTVRSVYADDREGRIYAGGSHEFGYFHNDPSTHTLKYVSWAEQVPKSSGDFTEIWNIHELPGGKIAFQGDYRIFIADGEEVKAVTSLEKLTASSVIASGLYAGSQNGHLYRLEGGLLHRLTATPVPSRIVALLPLGPEGIMAVTASDGLYGYEAGEMRPLDWEINSFLKENQAFCGAWNNGTYAFGTVNGGAAVCNVTTRSTDYINKATGLQNNTVLGMGFDFSGNLWLCLDNGLSYAVTESPFYNLLGDAAESGAGYASMLRGNRLYLATNRGLFAAGYPFAGSPAPPELTRLHGGQVWSLDSIGSDIFVSADDGLYVAGATGAPYRVEGVDGGAWFVAPLRRNPGKALASAYDGFYLLGKERGKWRGEGRIGGYDDSGGRFVEDGGGDIWLAHWIKGVYRLTPGAGYRTFSNVRLYTAADGLPHERDNSVALYDGKVRIATATGEFFQPRPDGSLEPDTKLTRQIPLKVPAHFMTLPQWAAASAFAFSPELVWKIGRGADGATPIDSVSLLPVARSLIPGFQHVGFLDRDNVLIAHQEGFFSVDLSGTHAERWQNGVFVESLASGDSVFFSGLPAGAQPNLKIPYTHNSLTFNVAAPEYRYEGSVLYSYFLEDYDKEWSTPTENASKEYTRLDEGRYVLRVRAQNTVTGHLAETSLPFEVLPPWYRSLPAKIVYILLAVGFIYLLYRILRQMSERKAGKIRRQKEAEMEMMRKETEKEAIRKDYEIAALKSEQLERDIKYKSSELSNTTMNVIRKNEILTDISGMIARLHEKAVEEGHSTPRLKREVDKIQNLIQENISHDDDWKKFNQNFDIVYADFTKRLSELYPDLTLAERRLCCYLKMGLSSKEIAPITGISPKSVEMNRYRLRKKLGLGREDNLVAFLQGI